MAEYKTYTCDKCGKHNSLRLKFAVDTAYDPVDDHRSTVTRFADLCHVHAIDQLQLLIATMNLAEQHALWQKLVRK